MINYLLIEMFRMKLDIFYNFYIEGFYDMKKFLDVRGFKEVEVDIFDDDDFVLEWIKMVNRKRYILKIFDSLFDEDKKLKFIKRIDWKDGYVLLKEIEELEEDGLFF